MGRVFGQPPAVLRYEKNILAVGKTTSSGRCGSSLAAFLCPSFVCPCGGMARGIFYYKTGDTRLKSKPDGLFSIGSFASERRKTSVIAVKKSHTRFFRAVGAKNAPIWR